jgi:hypothetical protein
MEPHNSHHQDDLSDMEQRLARWQPVSASRSAEEVVFAAGVAAGRRGRSRLVWPAVCALLAALSIGMTIWGASERAERITIASRVKERALAMTKPLPDEVAAATTCYSPSADDYFQMRRRAEQDPSRWLASLTSDGATSAGSPLPGNSIPKLGQRERVLNP